MVTVRIPEEDWVRYVAIAERELRSTSSAVRIGLKRDLAAQERRTNGNGDHESTEPA
jgi:hypothetical protein